MLHHLLLDQCLRSRLTPLDQGLSHNNQHILNLLSPCRRLLVLAAYLFTLNIPRECRRCRYAQRRYRLPQPGRRNLKQVAAHHPKNRQRAKQPNLVANKREKARRAVLIRPPFRLNHLKVQCSPVQAKLINKQGRHLSPGSLLVLPERSKPNRPVVHLAQIEPYPWDG